MRRGIQRLSRRPLIRAGAQVGALLLIAVLAGAGALYVTTDHDYLPSVAYASADPTSEIDLLAAARLPSLPALDVYVAPTRLQTMPSLEAIARITPRDIEVQAVSIALSMDSDAGSAGPPALAPGDRVEAPVTFYYCEHSEETPVGDGGNFCGIMRDGTVVFPGAAACHYDYLGQLFKIEGDTLEQIYRCTDTGSAIDGLDRDIWFLTSAEGWAWQNAVGTTAIITILP